MDEKEEREIVEKTLKELNERFLDINGEVLSAEDVIDRILKGDFGKRRFAEG